MEEQKELRTRTITAVKFEYNTKYNLKEFTKNLLEEYKGSINILAIRHDKDTKTNEETGEIEKVKPHWHFYLESKNAKKISTWANILDTDKNIIKLVKSKNGAIAYLTHRNNKEKAQYKEEEVITNFKKYKDLITSLEITNKQLYEDIRTKGNKAIIEHIDNIDLARLRAINTLVGTRRLVNAESKAFKYGVIANKYMEMLLFIKRIDKKELTAEEFKEEIIKRVLFEEEDINKLDIYLNFNEEKKEEL